MKLKNFFPVPFCAFLLAGSALAQSGQVAGQVLDDKGKAVKGVPISLRALPVPLEPDQAPPTAVRNFSAVSDRAGGYRFANVPPGIYAVCVSTADRDLIDPCTWEKWPPQAVVKPGQSVDFPIKLKAGHRFRVRVNDSQNRLAAAPGKPETGVLMTIEPTAMGPMLLAADGPQTGPVRQFSTLVPFDKDLHLRVHSGRFHVRDRAGAAVDTGKGSRLSFRARPGSPAAVIDLDVTGERLGVK